MRDLFENSELLRRARKNDLGWNVVIEVIKFILVIKAADALTERIANVFYVHHTEPFASLGGVWLFGVGLLTFTAIAYSLIWERMRPADIGVRFTPARKTMLGLAGGYAAGALIMGACFLLTTLLGGLNVTINVQSARALNVLWMLLIYLLQAFGEEVMYRGSLMMAIARKNSPWIAIAASSVMFSLHHYDNDGCGPVAFLNLFLLAVLLGMVTFRTNRIWAAGALHTAWNFFQGNIFGVKVSSFAPAPASALMFSTARGNPLISGGDMGLEGSLVSTAVLVVAIVVFVMICLRRKADAGQQEDVASIDASIARSKHMRG
jgi:membrane protease YdiL (CAAX protease family)